MARISFNLAAKCDKAGRSQNQDNYWVCPDLSRVNDSFDDVIGKDKDVSLSEKGALLVVADGMGGMNAGEKASELVIKGVQKGFSNIPEGILGNDDQMLSFIRDVIISSDQSVKDYAKANREADGLGSTIVLLWILGDKAYCGWCGDSRIYRYNPNNSLVRLSHDHSYVQELVDNGKIEPEEAFDHPDGNIVTRALGDNGEKANPELKVYDICERDVFLLCSDGLCGLLQDKQIEDIISVNCSSTKDALAALWKAGETEGWTDNATIDLLNIVEGGMRPKGVAVGYPVKRSTPVATNKKDNSKTKTPKGNIFQKISPKTILYVVAAIAIILLVIVLIRSLSKGTSDLPQQGDNNFVVTATDNSNGNPASGSDAVVSHNSSNQGSTHNSGGNNGNTSNSSGHHGNNGGQHGNATNNNIANTNNGNANNGVSNSDIGDVISNTNTPANNNNGANHQDMQQSENRHELSPTYASLLNGTINDYPSVRRTWNNVKQKGYRTKNEDTQLDQYLNNVNNITINQGKEPLNTNQQKDISILKALADEIRNGKENFPIRSANLPSGYHLIDERR